MGVQKPFTAASRILASLYLHPEDRFVPSQTTPEAVRKDAERRRREREHLDLLLDSLS